MSFVSIVTVCAEIDRRARAINLANSDYADLRHDLGELARENDDLRDQLGRSEDRRYEP